MAIVYYPSNASVYTREVGAGGLIEQTITLTPDTIFVFTGSVGITSSFQRGGRSMVLCSAYTPVLPGPDGVELTVPFSVTDGSSSLSWSVKRLIFRAQVSESVSSSVLIEKSVSTGAFSASLIAPVTLSANKYENYVTGTLPTLNSGDKVRFNIVDLGTAENWTIITEIASNS